MCKGMFGKLVGWLLFLGLILGIWYCFCDSGEDMTGGTLVQNLKGKKSEICDCLFGGDGDRI